MRIAVTGGSGFLGRWVVKALMDEGHEVVSLDITGNSGIRVNLTVYSHTKSALAQSRAEVVIHLAALAGAAGKGGGVESFKDPYGFVHVNVLGTLNVLESCRELGIKKVEIMSSFSPYGKASCPITESTRLCPENPYGASKACLETIAKVYARCYGIKTLVFRVPLICGEGQKEMNALREFVACAIKGEPLVVWGDGTTLREFVHPSDVARAYLLGLDYLGKTSRDYDVFVLGNRPVTMGELAMLVRMKVGRGEVKLLREKPRLFDQYTSRGKVETRLGWVPKMGVEEIIERVVREMMVVA